MRRRVSSLRRSALNDLLQLCKSEIKRELPKRKHTMHGAPLWAWLNVLRQDGRTVLDIDEARVDFNMSRYMVCDTGAERIAKKYDLTRVQARLLADHMYGRYCTRNATRLAGLYCGLIRDPLTIDQVTDKAHNSAVQAYQDIYSVMRAVGGYRPPVRLILNPDVTAIVIRLQLEGVTR